MTVPKVRTISRSGARFYVHPDDGLKAPGVTSIIDMLPKAHLRYWVARTVAAEAVANLGEVVNIVLRGGAEGAIDFLRRAPDREASQAAEIGSTVHAYFERLAQGEPVGRVHPDLQPYVDHFDAFLQEFTPEFIFLEETVWSETHNYAGSFDAFAVLAGEATVWLDYKTSRSGVYPEAALQLAAYRHADYILRPDGSRVPLPKADGGAVLHVRPEGWSLVPVRCDREVFEMFLHLRRIFDWHTDMRNTVLGKPVNESATGHHRSTPRPRRSA